MRHPALALLLALGACTTPFEVELPDEPPRLVVTSLFQADSLLVLDVERSEAILAPGRPSDNVEDATVTIFEDGVRVGGAVRDPFGVRYVSDVRPRAGRTYRVRVEAPGFEPAEAEDTVPDPRPFEADVERGPTPDPGRDRLDAVTVRFADPEGPDYYAVYGVTEVRAVGRPDATRLEPLAFESADPVLADGALDVLVASDPGPQFYVRGAFFSDQALPAGPTAIRIDVRRRQAFDGVVAVERLRLAVLSETYYRYQRAIRGGTDVDLFDQPARIPSNVEGGYGIFAAFAAAERVLPD